MKAPDGTILMHAKRPYDPVKAREYYLRTRKLKGRKKGSSEPTYTVTGRDGKAVKLTSDQLREQQAVAAKRVASIKKKLAKLNAELKKRVAEAKKAERESKKPDSAADKSKAAREAKKYRDKNQQKIANKAKKASSGGSKSSSDSKPDSVSELKEAIAGTQKKLRAAVERQRSLTTATKNG